MYYLVVFHIGVGLGALIAGGVSFAAKKGGAWHQRAGSGFFIAMILMSLSSVYLAWHAKQPENLLMGALTFYLLVSGWAAAQGNGARGLLDWWMLLVVLTVVTLALLFGWQALGAESGLKNGVTAGNFFRIAMVGGLFAVSDLRLLMGGGVFGKQRLRRHLWRMGLAMFIACLSFFFGQAQFLPQALVASNLHLLPVVLVLVLTGYWLLRYGLFAASKHKALALLSSTRGV